MMVAHGTHQRGPSTATIAASLLLPPLGVYWRRGTGPDFVIACALTVAGFLPGVGFALLSIFKPRRA